MQTICDEIPARSNTDQGSKNSNSHFLATQLRKAQQLISMKPAI